jgi:hypothetical protein
MSATKRRDVCDDKETEMLVDQDGNPWIFIDPMLFDPKRQCLRRPEPGERVPREFLIEAYPFRYSERGLRPVWVKNPTD